MRATSAFFVPPEVVRLVVVLVVVVGEVHIEQTFGKVQNELLFFSFHVDLRVTRSLSWIERFSAPVDKQALPGRKPTKYEIED